MIENMPHSNDPINGIDPADLQDLQGVGDRLDASKRKLDAADAVVAGYIQREMGQSQTPLTPHERRDKEVAAFVEDTSRKDVRGSVPNVGTRSERLARALRRFFTP